MGGTSTSAPSVPGRFPGNQARHDGGQGGTTGVRAPVVPDLERGATLISKGYEQPYHPIVGRRDLALAGTALAVSASIPAIAASPNPDADLLQRCDAYPREGLRILSSSSEARGSDLEVMRAQYQQTVKDGCANAETLRHVAALPAHTPEGVRAKAVIIRLYYLQAYPRARAALTEPASPEQQ